MAMTRIFKSGNSVAVRIPSEFKLETGAFEILRRGEEIILRKPRRSMAEAFAALSSVGEDFYAEGRFDAPPQERESLEDEAQGKHAVRAKTRAGSTSKGGRRKTA